MSAAEPLLQGVSVADIPVYVINLDRSPERLSAIAAELAELRLGWTRVAAVDGGSLGPPPWEGHDLPAFERHTGRRSNAAELGCYLSHVVAMRELVASGAPVALILEDDAQLPTDFRDVLTELLARACDWDLVQLAGKHGGMPRLNGVLGTGHRLVTFLAPTRGTAAYLLNRQAAEKYLAKLLPMRVPYDHEFDQAWTYGIRFRGVQPFPVRARGFGSTIKQKRSERGIKPWYRRSGALFYRLKVGLRRITHYLLADRGWMSSRS